MKPQKNEIVKGIDKQGEPFSDSIVVQNNESDSVVRKPNGLPTIASHDKIKGQLDK